MKEKNLEDVIFEWQKIPEKSRDQAIPMVNAQFISKTIISIWFSWKNERKKKREARETNELKNREEQSAFCTCNVLLGQFNSWMSKCCLSLSKIQI